jgi:5-oxoprolinase (ATP-hydrolysing)
VTDCNVMVGKLDPKLFPKVFGPGGDEPLDAEVVRRRFEALADEVERATGARRAPEAIADGFLEIAVANMANAIKHISVERGYDVTEYTLCCFGGAGGQHACLVADALGMTRVFIHPFAGVLSAYGMGLADVRALRQQAVEATLGEAALSRGRAYARRARDGRARRRGAPGHRSLAQSRAGARCTSRSRGPTRRSRCRKAGIGAVVAAFEERTRSSTGSCCRAGRS